jgi:hypothetical protein
MTKQKLVLNPGMLFVRRKDMRVWKVTERSEERSLVLAVNPDNSNETLTLDLTVPNEVLTLAQVESFYK